MASSKRILLVSHWSNMRAGEMNMPARSFETVDKSSDMQNSFICQGTVKSTMPRFFGDRRLYTNITPTKINFGVKPKGYESLASVNRVQKPAYVLTTKQDKNGVCK